MHTRVLSGGDGGHPNPAPWYISSAGYGCLRNTWAPGEYSFRNPLVTAHNESHRFDALFLLAGRGRSIKTLLGLFTELTGPPFLPPMYGLFLGDSDCYHNDRHGNSTQVAVEIARLYRKFDMPAGWMLPNDGYGCGYGEGPTPFPSNLTDLTLVVAQLHEQGFFTGLYSVAAAAAAAAAAVVCVHVQVREFVRLRARAFAWCGTCAHTSALVCKFSHSASVCV